MLYDSRNAISEALNTTKSTGLPVGYGESFAAQRELNNRVNLSISKRANFYEAYDDVNTQYYQATGNILMNPAQFDSGPDREKARIDFWNKIDQAREQFPDIEFPSGHEAIEQTVLQKINDAVEHLESIQGRQTFLGEMGQFSADVVTPLFDPPVQASFIFGAPAASRVLVGALIEAGIAMGAEAAVQPSIQSYREEVGLPAGFDQALTNVLAAGGGAAGLYTLIRGTGAGLRALVDTFRKEIPNPTPHQEAAVAHIEEYLRVVEETPEVINEIRARADHRARFDEAILAAREGNLAVDIDTPKTTLRTDLLGSVRRESFDASLDLVDDNVALFGRGLVDLVDDEVQFNLAVKRSAELAERISRASGREAEALTSAVEAENRVLELTSSIRDLDQEITDLRAAIRDGSPALITRQLDQNTGQRLQDIEDELALKDITAARKSELLQEKETIRASIQEEIPLATERARAETKGLEAELGRKREQLAEAIQTRNAAAEELNKATKGRKKASRRLVGGAERAQKQGRPFDQRVEESSTNSNYVETPAGQRQAEQYAAAKAEELDTEFEKIGDFSENSYAQAKQILEENQDIPFYRERSDGTMEEVKASDIFREIDEERTMLDEFQKCIKGQTESPE